MADGLPLARIHPSQRAVTGEVGHLPAQPVTPRSPLTSRQKAAVIVRWLISEGAPLQVNSLSDQLQTALAEQMGVMRLIDRETLQQVVHEFSTELDSVGLSFIGGIEGALSAMDGQISQTAANRLRRRASDSGGSADPWTRLTGMAADRLVPVLETESIEVAAVILSKLPAGRAADVLGKLPGEKARRIAFAVSQTGNIDPDTVRRIGSAILAHIDNQPVRAFDRGPVERVGAILNITDANTREEVLRGLEQDDAHFAEKVRRAIFTWAHIPRRLMSRDVPKVVRQVNQQTLVTAMAYGADRPDLAAASEFILNGISQRMAELIREEIASAVNVTAKDGENAMQVVVNTIRQLEERGELVMVIEEE